MQDTDKAQKGSSSFSAYVGIAFHCACKREEPIGPFEAAEEGPP